MLKLHAQFALMFSLEELFCSVDDFCKGFEPQWKQQLLGSGLQLRKRQRSLNLSEIMTILIAFPELVLPQRLCCKNFLKTEQSLQSDLVKLPLRKFETRILQ